MWPDIAKFPRFSCDTVGFYLGNTGYIMPTDQAWLLGFLGSRVAWFLISNIAVSLGERAGLNRYRLIDQYMRPLPIPSPTAAEQAALATIAMQLTQKARSRYDLHHRARRRILSDLGATAPGNFLNQKLTTWWQLDFAALRAELRKVFRRDISLKERDEWEEWFNDQLAEHQRLTTEIVRRETELNDLVYDLFDLTPRERQFIEESTKYAYGEV